MDRVSQIVLSLLMLFVCTVNASGASRSISGDVLTISGPFNSPDDLGLLGGNFWNDNPGLTKVRLDSSGGNEGVALFLAVGIGRHGLATRVEKGKTCAGACMWVLLSGKTRSVDRLANITAVKSNIVDSGLAKAGGVDASNLAAGKQVSQWANYIDPAVDKVALTIILGKADAAKKGVYRLKPPDLYALGIDIGP